MMACGQPHANFLTMMLQLLAAMLLLSVNCLLTLFAGVVVAFQANQLPCPEVEVTIPGRPPYSVCAQHTLKPRSACICATQDQYCW